MIKDDPLGEDPSPQFPKPKSGRASSFTQRRADNLRANLLKRKEQSRARSTSSTPSTQTGDDAS